MESIPRRRFRSAERRCDDADNEDDEVQEVDIEAAVVAMGMGALLRRRKGKGMK
mgnify:CR=1 FL=1